MKRIFTILIAIVIFNWAEAQVPLLSWAKTVEGNTSGTDYVPRKCMAVDNSGNSYLAAYSEGAGTGGDILIIKLSNKGDTLWTRRYDGPDHLEDVPVSLQLHHSSGNVYISGNSASNSSGSDIVTIGYSSFGSLLAGWPKRYDHNNQNDYVNALVLDGSNPIIAGSSFNWISNFSNNDMLAVKYNSSSSLQWEKGVDVSAFGTSGDDVATAVTTDPSGNVIVAGSSTEGYHQGTYFYIVGFLSATGLQYGQTGTVPSNNGAVPTAIKYDNGFVYVAGSVNGDITIERYNGTTLDDFGSLSQTIINPTSSNEDVIYDLEIEPGSHNLILCGKYKNSSGDYDGILLKYNSALVQQFQPKIIGGTNNQDDEFTDLTVSSSSGNPIYVTGYTDNSNSGRKGMYAGIFDFSNGNVIWTNANYQSTLNNDRGNNIGLDSYKHIYISGSAKSLNRDIQEIKYCALYPNASAGTNTSICEGDSITLSGSGGGSYIWTPAASLDDPTIAIPYAAPTQPATIYTLIVSYNGCDDTDAVTITLNPLPPIPTITQTGYALASTPAVSYQWYFNNAPIATNQTLVMTQDGEYKVEVTDANGCKRMSSVIIGIDELASVSKFTVTPNPSYGRFTLDVETLAIEQVDIKVFNLFGQLIKGEMSATVVGSYTNEIDLGNAAKGIYMLQLKSGTQILNKKIQVQ